MKPYKLVHETPSHFVLHDGQAHFHIAKNGIDQPTADKIRSFAEGGKAEFEKSPYEAGVEAKSQKDAVLKNANISPSQSNDEIEIEAAEKQKRQQEPHMSEGGKLDANARAHISKKNFALPGGRYPIEDENHARNALARVSQHGSPEEKAQVRSKVHSKYPGIAQSHAEGGEVSPEPTPKPQSDLSPGEEIQMYKHGKDVTSDYDRGQYKAMKQLKSESGLPMYSDGGEAQGSEDPGMFEKLSTSISGAFEKPKPQPTPTDHEEQYKKIRETNSENMRTGNYAEGGSIETQEQAIKRYADGNPANLAKGGHVHHNAGKNQLHFHFYDGAQVPHFAEGTPEGTVADQLAAEDSKASIDSTSPTSVNLSAQDVNPNAEPQLKQPTPSPTETPESTNTEEASSSPTIPTPSANSVPKEQQISAAPKATAPTPDQKPGLLGEYDRNLELQKQGIQAVANAQQKGFEDTAQAIGENVLEQQKMQAEYKKHAAELTAQNDQIFNAVKDSKIDPNHYWADKSTGGKIMATIGVLLGGAASGMAGGSGQNLGLQTLQNNIQRDIDAQKNDQSKGMNLYKMGLERYRDEQSAQQFATLQSNALLQGQLQKIAAQTGNAQSQAMAQQMIGQLGVQSAGLRSELAIKDAAMQAMNEPTYGQHTETGGVDPNKMRLLIAGGIIPKEEVPQAMKEFGEHQKLSNMLDETENVFKQANQDATRTQRIAEGLPFGSHIPTTRAATKNYLAETNAFLDKMTKDLTGRVTPQSMENLRHSIPVAGDPPEVQQRKLSVMKDIIRSGYDFPTLNSYKLIKPNDPVATSSGTRSKRFNEGPAK